MESDENICLQQYFEECNGESPPACVSLLIDWNAFRKATGVVLGVIRV